MSEPRDEDFDPMARAALAGQLALQLGFARTQTELLTRLCNSLPEMASAMDALADVGLADDAAPDPALVRLLSELVASNNAVLKRADGTAAVLDTVADLKSFLRAGGQLPAGFTPPPDRDAQRSAATAVIVGELQKELAPVTSQLADLFSALTAAGKAFAAKPDPAATPERGRFAKALDWLSGDGQGSGFASRMQAASPFLSAAGGVVGRLSRKARRGLASVANSAAGRATGRALGGGLRGIGRGVAAARSATGLMSGAGMGARAGAAGGPLGAIGGAVAGAVVGMVGGITNAGVGVFTTLAASLTRYLNPVAVMSAAINSNTSGYSSVGRAFSLLGSTLGLFLLPLFLAFGGLILAVVGEVGESLLPALRDWSGLVIAGATDAVQKLQAAFIYAKEKVEEFGQWLERNSQGVKTGAAALSPVAGLGMAAWDNRKALTGAVTPDRLGEILDNIRNGRNPTAGGANGSRDGGGAGGFDGAEEPKSFMDRFRDGMKEMGRDILSNMGPKAQYTSSEDYRKQLQLAAINNGGIEEQNRKNLDKMAKFLESIDANTKTKPKQ